MHQIRRHFHHISHPVIGDTTYGDGRHNRIFRERFGCRRLLLTCEALTLNHPRTGKPLHLTVALEPFFQKMVEQLGWGQILSESACAYLSEEKSRYPSLEKI
jgi:tRNA pseudouridine65 synthase